MPNVPKRERENEWSVSIPFSDLHKLVDHLGELDSVKADNARLRREMDGLRNLYSELLIAFGDLKREMKKR